MARLRFDAVAGSLDLGSLASGVNVMTSSALADLGFVGSGNTADLAIYRRDSVTGRITQYEVLQVTSHSAGTNTAIVNRGVRGTYGMPSGQGFTWASGSTWTHGANQDDFSPSAIGADPAGAAAVVQTNLTAEVNRATTAEGLISAAAAAAQATANAALPKSGGTMTGAIDMGTHKITHVTPGTDTTDVATFGQVPTTLPPSGSAGGDLTGSYPNPSLKNTGTAGTYGDAATLPRVTTDSAGRVTQIVPTTIAITESQVTNLTYDLSLKAPGMVNTSQSGSTYSANPSDFVLADISHNSMIITLPAAPAAGTTIGVKIIAKSLNYTITVNRSGSDVFSSFSGASSIYLTLLSQEVVFQYRAGSWDLTFNDLTYDPVQYGADPTGTQDATATIQYLLNTYGRVDLPAGKFSVTSLWLPSGSSIVGRQSMNHVSTLMHSPAATGALLNVAPGVNGVLLRDLYCDGSQGGSNTNTLANYSLCYGLRIWDNALSTTMSNASAGASSITVANAANMISRSVLNLDAAYSNAETVIVSSVSGTTLTLASPLVNTHNGSSFGGSTVEANLSSSVHIDDVGFYYFAGDYTVYVGTNRNRNKFNRLVTYGAGYGGNDLTLRTNRAIGLGVFGDYCELSESSSSHNQSHNLYISANVFGAVQCDFHEAGMGGAGNGVYIQGGSRISLGSRTSIERCANEAVYVFGGNTSLSGASGSGSSVTFTTASAHGFRRGQYVTITGYAGGFNGYYQITSTTATSFSVASSTSGTASGAGIASYGAGPTDVTLSGCYFASNCRNSYSGDNPITTNVRTDKSWTGSLVMSNNTSYGNMFSGGNVDSDLSYGHASATVSYSDFNYVPDVYNNLPFSTSARYYDAAPPTTSSVQIVEVGVQIGTPDTIFFICSSPPPFVVRPHTANLTLNSPIISNYNGTLTLADVGRAVSGAGLPSNCYVGAVISSNSFELSSSPTQRIQAVATATTTGTTVTLADVISITGCAPYYMNLSNVPVYSVNSTSFGISTSKISTPIPNLTLGSAVSAGVTQINLVSNKQAVAPLTDIFGGTKLRVNSVFCGPDNGHDDITVLPNVAANASYSDGVYYGGTSNGTTIHFTPALANSYIGTGVNAATISFPSQTEAHATLQQYRNPNQEVIAIDGGMVSAPVIASTGTEVGGTGARFVGGVTGAAPTTGTWVLGDFVVDQTGYLWVCTVAGSPGTWKRIG